MPNRFASTHPCSMQRTNVKLTRLCSCRRKTHEVVKRYGHDNLGKNATDLAIKNIVGRADCGFGVLLEHLVCSKYSKYIEIDSRRSRSMQYEPEIFPGLIYKSDGEEFPTRVTVIVFASGKVIMTGGQSQTEVDNAFEKVFQRLVEFKVPSPPPPPHPTSHLSCPPLPLPPLLKDTTVVGSKPVEIAVGAR
jgi:hypothetical protein